MPNTYSQLYIQIVFAVRGRQNLVPPKHREEIHKYITGIVQERKHKMLSIFCMPDHLHLLAGIQPDMAISDLVRDIKAGSSRFINDRGLISNKFNWQEGYGAFSYSRNQIDQVIKYILGQEEHHKKKTFCDEYTGLLREFDIPYKEKYLFEWIH
jgi:putative transposase